MKTDRRPCACGGWILGGGSEKELIRAINAHQKSELHESWRRRHGL